LPEDQQQWATPFAPRCIKDRLEEALFAARRELFTSLDIVFLCCRKLFPTALAEESTYGGCQHMLRFVNNAA